jgi:hypothetical protein
MKGCWLTGELGALSGVVTVALRVYAWGEEYTIRNTIAVQFCSMAAQFCLILPDVDTRRLGNLGRSE